MAWAGLIVLGDGETGGRMIDLVGDRRAADPHFSQQHRMVKDVAVDRTTGLIYTVDLAVRTNGQHIYVVDPETGAGAPLPPAGAS